MAEPNLTDLITRIVNLRPRARAEALRNLAEITDDAEDARERTCGLPVTRKRIKGAPKPLVVRFVRAPGASSEAIITPKE